MKPQQAQRLRDILLLLGAFVMLTSPLFGEAQFLVGMVIALSSLIPHFLYNKCTHCGRQLNAWTHRNPYCPFCGKRVDGGDE